MDQQGSLPFFTHSMLSVVVISNIRNILKEDITACNSNTVWSQITISIADEWSDEDGVNRRQFWWFLIVWSGNLISVVCMRVLPSMEQLISNKQKLTSVQDYSVIRTSDGPLCITRLTYVNVSETTISLNGRLILCPLLIHCISYFLCHPI